MVWNVTLLNLGCCWRKQADGRSVDRPTTLSVLLLLPVEAKLCDRSRSGIARASVSRSTQTDLHTKPNQRTHLITAFRNNDHRSFCPAFDTTQDNQRPSGLTSSSTAAHYGQTTTKITTTKLRAPRAVFTALTSGAVL